MYCHHGRPPSASLEEFSSELADQLVDQSLRGISKGSSESVEWRCAKYPDHTWFAKIYNRTNSKNLTGCPICDGEKVLQRFNDVATTHPEAAALLLNPEDRKNFTASSNKKFQFWCGNKDRQPWAAPMVRVTMQGSRCGQCSGREAVHGVNDIATTHPKIAAQLKAGSEKIVE